MIFIKLIIQSQPRPEGDDDNKKDAAAIGFDDQFIKGNWNRRLASGICRADQ